MLVIRCERCQTVVWFTRDHTSSITCSHCDQQYELPTKIRERTMEEIHRQAYGLAIELKVDFPSATSMVFGILKLPQVQEFLVEEDDEEVPKPELEESAWSGSFDEAFRPAVEAGRLSSYEAMHRGRRDSYAAQIVERHGISMKNAYRVADNEETLLSVLRRRKPVAPRKLMKPRRVQYAILFALGLVAVALLSVWRIDSGIRKDVEMATAREVERVERIEQDRESQQSVDLPAAMRATASGLLTQLYHDQTGQITRIVAPEPEAVLQAYCRRAGLQPLSLASGMLPDKNLWLGIYADSRRPDQTQAIAIRKSGKGNHWFAGSGRSEIEVLKLEPTRLGRLRQLDSRPLELNVVEIW